MEEEQDIQSDIVKQKQLRDAQKYKSFSQEIKAINKADKAGNLTDQDRIEGHKRASNIYRGIEEQSSGSPVGDDIITKARLTFNKLSPYVPVVKQIREIFKPWFDTDSRGNITFNPNKVTAENYLESTGNLIKYQIQNPGMGYLPASEDPALTQYSGQIDTIKKQRFTPDQIIALKDQILRQVNPNQLEFFGDQEAISKNLPEFITYPMKRDMPAYSKEEPEGYFDYHKMKNWFYASESKGRKALEAGMTPVVPGTQISRGVSFSGIRKAELPKLRRNFEPILKALGIDVAESVSIHHIAALKATYGILHKVQVDSPLFREIYDVLLEYIPGLGNMKGNLVPVVGMTKGKKQVSTPHSIVHRFYSDTIGESGELFFKDDVLEEMVNNKAYRIEKARELGRIIARSEKIVKEARKIWDIGFSQENIHFESSF